MANRNQKIATLYMKGSQTIIKINFPFNRDDIENVKSIPGRRYYDDKYGKYWTCPLTVKNIKELMSFGFTIEEALMDVYRKHTQPIPDVDQLTSIKIPGLKGKLRPFQEKGVAFIESKGGNALIADEMGLGKTVQALAWLQLHPELRPAIIVCPASLKLNWAKETRAWLSKPNYQIISGKSGTDRLTKDIIIINYDILNSWMAKLIRLKPQVIITDECHYYKSNKAQRTVAVKRISKYIPHKIALSGTPIINRPVEIYNAVNLIDPTVLPNYWDFTERYCGRTFNGFGWDFSGATNTQELHDLLSRTVMIRRKKTDVLKELPDKVFSFTPIALDNTREYKQAEKDFVSWIRINKGVDAARKASGAETLVQIETLKQLAVRGKLKVAKDWIKDFLDSGEKLVVFGVHKFVIEELMKEFGSKAVKIDGSVSMTQRHRAVEAFQNDPNVQLFIGNIQAAGVGLTLTAASNVLFLELPWTPGELSQAEDRCHRIGQKDSVTVHYLLANGTIEQRIAKLIDHKRKILNSVLDGKEPEKESLIGELMNTYLTETA